MKGTFRMPSRLTIFADTNVAMTPIKAHNPLKPPIIDGFSPEALSNTSIEDLDYHKKAEKKKKTVNFIFAREGRISTKGWRDQTHACKLAHSNILLW